MPVFKYLIAIIACCTAYWAAAQPLPAHIPYRNGDKWGYCDSNKKVLIAPQWDEVDFFRNGRAKVTNKNSYSLIDTAGTYILPPSMQWTGNFAFGTSDRGALNAKDTSGKWGMVNDKGELVIPCLYDKSFDLYHNPSDIFMKKLAWSKWFMIVNKNGRYGIIDTLNNTLIPFEYDTIYQPERYYSERPDAIENPYIIVKRNGKKGVIDTNNNVVIPAIYDNTHLVSESNYKFFIVAVNGQTGAVNNKNKKIVPLAYDNVGYARDHVRDGFLIQKKNLWGWQGVGTKLTIAPKYQFLDFREDGSIIVKTTLSSVASVGILDRKGRMAIPPVYTMIGMSIGNDTIKAYMQEERGDSEYLKYIPFSKRTYKPMDGWVHMPTTAPSWLKQNFKCGTQSYSSPDTRPYIGDVNNKIYSFTKDSVHYTVTGLIKYGNKQIVEDGSVKTYYTVSSSNKLWGVVDDSCNFRIRPQKIYEFMSGNMEKNVFIVKHNDLWGAVDSNLNVLVALQPLPIIEAVKWNNQYYALTKPDSPATRMLIDNKGILLSSFKNFRVGPFCDYNGMGTRTMCGYFIVADSLDKLGVVDINGITQYPEVSFKHREIEGIGNGLFFVGDGIKTTLADLHNNMIFPNMEPRNFEYVWESNGNQVVKSRPPTLIKITYKIANKPGYPFFYTGRNAMIYADNIGQ